MPRTRRIVAWGTGLLVGALVLAVGAYVAITETDAGRARLQTWIADAATGVFDGRGALRIGRIDRLRLHDIQLRDVELVDSTGAVVLSAARVDAALSLRGILRGTIFMHRLELDGVALNLLQDIDGPWNLVYLLSGDADDTAPPPEGRRLGDEVTIRRLTLRDATIAMRYPWEPNAVFTGAERDSVIAVRDSLHDMEITPRGIFERRTIDISTLYAHDVEAITFDDAPGTLQIDSAALTISDPPVTIADVSGSLAWYPDSLRFDTDRVRLPGSRLAAAGMLDWSEEGAVRYEVLIDAPEVALADLNWVWPVLPLEGTASASVRMRTLDNADHLEIMLTELTASALDSRISGRIGLIAEPKDLKLFDVALAFDPMTTPLVARITEDALPPELDGRLTGRFVAREGGSLTALRIDTLLLAFDDARIPGARSRVRAGGVVSIGVTPSAENLLVSDLSVDMRTVRALVPDAATMVDGMITGRARIVSASLDAADVRDLTLQWTDGAGQRSSVTGRSAVRWTGSRRRADVDIAFDPLSLDALHRMDTLLPVMGTVQGALRASGSWDSLTVAASVMGAVGTLGLEGWGGIAPLRGDTVRWRGDLLATVDTLNVAAILRGPVAPATAISGTVQLAGHGVGAIVADGTTRVQLAQTASATRTPFDLFAVARLDADALQVDTLLATATGLRVEGDGGLARDSAGRETFRLSVRADSIDVVRAELPRIAAMIGSADTALAETLRAYGRDTVSGALQLSAFGEGSFAQFVTSVAVAGNELNANGITVGRVFGSVRVDGLPNTPRYVAAATIDSVEGLGALRIATINAGVTDASTAGGGLRLDVVARDTSRLRVRGAFAQSDDTLSVSIDTVRFTYNATRWANTEPFALRSDGEGFTLAPFRFVSNQGGTFAMEASLPANGEIRGSVNATRLPIGELAAFALGTDPLPGVLSGEATLSGSRIDPRMTAAFTIDSVGTQGATLSGARLNASYQAQVADVQLSLQDEAGRALRVDLELPVDGRLTEVVGDRIYSDALVGSVSADSLRVADLPLALDGIRDLGGVISGRIDLSGTFDNPIAIGGLRLDGGTLYSEALGIRPQDVQLVLAMDDDSVRIAPFRMRSGPRAADTMHVRATVARPLRSNPTVAARAYFNNVQLARQRDGTEVDLSGTVQANGPLSRPVVSADLLIPRGTLVYAISDAANAVDLNSEQARELLGEDELPTAESAADQFASLGEFLEVRGVRVRLGNEVWVRTVEATVKLLGDVTVLEATGQRLSLDGEIQAERGTYRLDLGVVNRGFLVDSGRVRFFPQDDLNPTLDIHATHTVRGVDGRDVDIFVVVGGTLEAPTLRLGTTDESFAQAPESEFISLLVFGAPTFALDGQSQQTVRAVTGVLLPTLSGAVEGTLQRLLPVFNTVQVSTAGGQSGEELGGLSLLDNLAVTAGKQLGTRTYLRLDTGVCRSAVSEAAGALSLWYGVAVEYRLARGLTGQVGVDPGPSPCGQVGPGAGRRMQFGFDLFKEWVF